MLNYFEGKNEWNLIKVICFFISETLREKCPNTEVFLVRISRIQNEYGEIPSISPYSVRMREYTDQKKLHIRTLFTQWKVIR